MQCHVHVLTWVDTQILWHTSVFFSVWQGQTVDTPGRSNRETKYTSHSFTLRYDVPWQEVVRLLTSVPATCYAKWNSDSAPQFVPARPCQILLRLLVGKEIRNIVQGGPKNPLLQTWGTKLACQLSSFDFQQIIVISEYEAPNAKVFVFPKWDFFVPPTQLSTDPNSCHMCEISVIYFLTIE